MPLATLPALVVALALGESPAKGTFALNVEPNHSTVGFSIPIAAGMTRVTGKFTDFEVHILMNETDLGNCSVEATIKATSIDTGISARDVDLRGAAFFDTSTHPLIHFKSMRVEKTADGYLASGPLTIRGVTREIHLPFLVTGLTWEGGRPALGVSARLTLNRLDFHVGADWRHTAIPNFLGEEVGVEIFLWTRLGRPAEASP